MKKLFIATSLILASGSLFANTLVDMKTSMGTIEIELYDDQAPISAKNFENWWCIKKYAKKSRLNFDKIEKCK